MKEHKKNIKIGSKGMPEKDPWTDRDNNLLLTYEDNVLCREIEDFIKGKLDIEDAMNDPRYNEIENITAAIISGYAGNNRKEDENFIKESLSPEASTAMNPEDLSDINREILENDLDKVTEGWIKDWDDRNKKCVKSRGSEEISDYILDSLKETAGSESVISKSGRKSPGRKLYLRYLASAAAVITGLIFLARSIMPSDDTGKLFMKYYQPLSAMQSVTRGANDAGDAMNKAIEFYRLGRYEEASLAFSDILSEDASAGEAAFFLGITDMALGKYTSASELLEKTATNKGEFESEAVWYLGLTYLKTGNREGASGCFSRLSQSPGFYSRSAGKILRRLK